MELKFRHPFPQEIDCRIGTINSKGLSLLLYQDARVGMTMLDETVGPMGWKREHQLIGDRLYCIVSIWDDEKKQWVSKMDVGTESNTEPEKGQASDSFKRAVVNWGVCRELYSAPFIWITPDGYGADERNGKPVCKDRFRVSDIGYDQAGNISHLRIINERRLQIVFEMGYTKEEKKAAKASQKAKEAPKPIGVDNPTPADLAALAALVREREDTEPCTEAEKKELTDLCDQCNVNRDLFLGDLGLLTYGFYKAKKARLERELAKKK